MTTAGQILLIQQRLVDLINASTFFNDPNPSLKVLAITRRKGVIQQEVALAILRAGAGVVVTILGGKPQTEADRFMIEIDYGVIVTENPMVNQSTTGTGKPAEQIIEKLIPLIHWKPQVATANPRNQSTLFKVLGFRPLPPSPDAKAVLNYLISVRTSITIT